MCYRIAYRIESICKKLGIKWKSSYLKKTNFHTDALKLNELYQQMRQIVAEIIEIADKHGAEDLSEMLWKDINAIENADHDIVKIAKLMDKRGK